MTTMYEEMLEDEENILKHYGVAKRSGRYPWGSGKETYQRTSDFVSRIDEFRRSGMTEKEVATAFGLTTTQFRVQESLAKAERRQTLVDTAKDLKDRGMSLQQIADQMGYKNDSSVRSLLNESSAQKMNQAEMVANTLKKHIDEKGMIDVGAGTELELHCSKEKLGQALYILEREGYPTFTGGIDQVTSPGQRTITKVIGPPGTEHKDIYDTSKVNTIRDYNASNGEAQVSVPFRYPTSVSLDRVGVRYAEEGGITKDGTIELRRGVADLDLQGSAYSQVRILVDGDRYLKGMAVYKDDSNFPPGVDIMFNTNKPASKGKRGVMKEIKEGDENPFGSAIIPFSKGGQYVYKDKDGNEKLGAINKRGDEGDWDNWAEGLPSQFLSKQNISLIKKQLNETRLAKEKELEEIMAIDNPTVKKHFLDSYASDADASAGHLKMGALPRQKYQVIIPEDTLKDTEVFAPNYRDGEKLALIRFPHAGTFEIPIVTVNNKNEGALKTLGSNPKDAIAINSRVAERLSGADFDGDTVMCIPTGSGGVNVKSTKPLKDLVNFDPKAEYPERPGMKYMSKANIGKEMGGISNLITDMSMQNATEAELARAVKHSMCVIDAYKHKLDYKKSAEDNGIAALKKKYSPRIDKRTGEIVGGGASTLISRASGEKQVDKRVGSPKINLKGKDWYDPSRPEGAIVYKTVQEVYIDHKTGQEKVRKYKSTQMAETDDARTLMSKKPSPQEELYADYANAMKDLANKARIAKATTGNIKMVPEAKKQYESEVISLGQKLQTSQLNAPKERQAQRIANQIVKVKKEDNPSLYEDKDALKKVKQHAITTARERVGAKRVEIDITDREWEAIQAGAVSENTLSKILRHADVDNLRQRATPRQNKELSTAKANKATQLKAAGYTNAEIAQALGISISAVNDL